MSIGRDKRKTTYLGSTLHGTEPSKETMSRHHGSGIALGIVFGVAIGAAIGSALNNLALGIAIGIALGTAVGLVFPSKSSQAGS